MKKGDKEFYELMEQFEKDINKLGHGQNCRLDRTGGKVPEGIFYDDGYTNAIFHAYMMGYENAKCLARMGAI
jgi:hypothetical protein